jgi:hypothetical protein
MSQIYNINNNLVVSGSSRSLSVSATTITGMTLTGQIDAKYIGTGQTINSIPNLVTNQEFEYLSGLTGYAQTQINNKVPITAPLLVYSASPLITNALVVSAGTNIVVTSSQTNYSISARIGSLEVGSILVITGGNENYAVNNFNPNGWDGTYPNRATNINILPTNVIKITGLAGGTTGRIATLSNVGSYPIIFELNSTGSTITNTFNFTYFLNPKSSLTLIYNNITQKWTTIQPNNTNGFKIYDKFTNVPFITPGGGVEFTKTYTPFPTTYFTVDINNGSFSNNNGAGFTGYGEGLSTYTSFGSTPTLEPRVRVGTNGFSNISAYTSGTSFLYVTSIKHENFNQFGNIGYVNGFNSASTVAHIVGFENSFLSRQYTGLTSNNTLNPPSCSGGTFWLIDFSGNPNYLRYVVQSTGNTTIISSSTFPISAITVNGSANYYNLGVHYLNSSGGTNGWATFFYTLPNSNEWVIHEKINDNNMSIAGFAGNSMYRSYSFTSQNGTQRQPRQWTGYIGMSITNLT